MAVSFDAQRIVIGVPASLDFLARQLRRPAATRVLESAGALIFGRAPDGRTPELRVDELDDTSAPVPQSLAQQTA